MSQITIFSRGKLGCSTANPDELVRYLSRLGFNTDGFTWNHPANIRGGRYSSSLCSLRLCEWIHKPFTGLAEVRYNMRTEMPTGFDFANLQQFLRMLLEGEVELPKKGVVVAFGGVVLADPDDRSHEMRLVPALELGHGKRNLVSTTTLSCAPTTHVYAPVVKRL